MFTYTVVPEIGDYNFVPEQVILEIPQTYFGPYDFTATD
jgi:hypothetical protein